MSTFQFDIETPTRYKAIGTFKKSEYSAQKEKCLLSLQKSKQINGFRLGKAPLSVIEKRFATDLERNLIPDVLNAHISELDKSAPKPIYQIIQIDSFEYQDDKLNIHFTFDIENIVDLGKHEKAKFMEHTPKIDDTDLKNSIGYIKKMYITLESTEEKKPAKSHFLTLDLEIWQDGVPIGEPQKNLTLILGEYTILGNDKQNSKELEEYIIKEAPEVNKSITFKKEINKKSVEFYITIHTIQRCKYPELTDTFIKEKFNLDTVDDLHKDIKKSLASTFQKHNFLYEATSFINTLSEIAKIEISDSFYKKQWNISKADLDKLPKEQQKQIKTNIFRHVIQQYIIDEYLKIKEKSYNNTFKEYITKTYSEEKTKFYMTTFDKFLSHQLPQNSQEYKALDEKLHEMNYYIVYLYAQKKSLVKKGSKLSYHALMDKYNNAQ